MEGLPRRRGRRPRPGAGRRGGGGQAGRRVGVLSAQGRRVVLWRHGRTQWNSDGRFQGQLDSPLDDAGRADIALAAQVLAQLPPTRIIVSSAGRACASAAYLSAETGMDAEPSDALREIALGSWQGLTRDEAMSRFRSEYDAWTRGEDVRRGGGETYVEVGERARAVIDEALAAVPTDGVLVVVTHGGTARATLGTYLELPPATWWRLAPLGNARWSVLLETDRGFRLAEHNAGVTEPVDRSRIAAPDVEPGEVREPAGHDI